MPSGLSLEVEDDSLCSADYGLMSRTCAGPIKWGCLCLYLFNTDSQFEKKKMIAPLSLVCSFVLLTDILLPMTEILSSALEKKKKKKALVLYSETQTLRWSLSSASLNHPTWLPVAGMMGWDGDPRNLVLTLRWRWRTTDENDNTSKESHTYTYSHTS